MQYESPVVQRHTPLLFDILDGQVNGLLCCPIIGELYFGLDVLSNAAVEVLNGVGGVNDLSDLQGEVKVSGQVLPVGLPGLDGIAVFSFPFLGKIFKGIRCSRPGRSGINLP